MAEQAARVLPVVQQGRAVKGRPGPGGPRFCLPAPSHREAGHGRGAPRLGGARADSSAEGLCCGPAVRKFEATVG
eukprot:5808400-Pyramimonas_sp.AAC.1